MITQLPFCPYCKNEQVIRHGTAKGKQRYCCHSYTRAFCENPGTPPKKVSSCITMHFTRAPFGCRLHYRVPMMAPPVGRGDPFIRWLEVWG